MTLLGEDKVISKMASGRPQRWEIFCPSLNTKLNLLKEPITQLLTFYLVFPTRTITFL